MTISAKIIEILSSQYGLEENEIPKINIISDGHISSLDVVTFVASLEAEFNVSIQAIEMKEENFDTLSVIEKFIASKI